MDRPIWPWLVFSAARLVVDHSSRSSAHLVGSLRMVSFCFVVRFDLFCFFVLLLRSTDTIFSLFIHHRSTEADNRKPAANSKLSLTKRRRDKALEEQESKSVSERELTDDEGTMVTKSECFACLACFWFFFHARHILLTLLPLPFHLAHCRGSQEQDAHRRWGAFQLCHGGR